MTATKEQMRLWDRWFVRSKRPFITFMREFAERPVVYVEIGCWAGASANWAARRILTEPRSIGVGIDPYLPNHRHDAVEMLNVKRCAAERLSEAIGKRWTWMYEPSMSALPKLRSVIGRRRVDALYIDGVHEMEYVLTDFLLAWQYLRTGSIVIFDDYTPVKEAESGSPCAAAAFHALLAAFRGRVQEVYTPYPEKPQRALIVTAYE